MATISRFFALLSLAALVLAAGLALARLAAFVPRGRRPWARVVESSGPQALSVAWLVAAVSTAGSLYYSEVAGLVPCDLCWFQRIAMYPLCLVLAIAALRKDTAIRIYVLPASVIGLAIAAYHYWLQLNPDGPSFCTVGVSCSARLVEEFGFVSIPFMSACGFAAITMLLMTCRKESGALEEA